MSTSELVMPRLSDTMEEGTILRWLKGDGDSIERGEELVEIETDKATMTYESDLAGVLRILAGEGATLAVGELIATVGDAGETPTAQPAQPESPATGAQTVAKEPPAPAQVAPPSTSSDADTGRVKASPLARRIAGKSGIDLHEVTGSGPGGRIVKADVEGVSANGPGASPPDAGSTPAPAEGVATAKGQATDVELTRTQQTIARRMAESKATIPDFSIQAEVDMEACVTLRSDLKRLSQGERSAEPGADAPLATPTYNDMVVKACALALREHPRANGSYRDGRLQLHSRINVGVAVAAEDALVVPTVFDAEEKSLGEIARETRRLAERVRDRTITPPELGGGTFTVSNLGMYGVRSFTAIVNPPQAAILSVGSLEPRAVVREGELTVRNTMMLTLVCDHRILYGADAAQLLARIRELLEAPAALTL
ncbi:MAG TPA: dihydrolipoamide acetyltransferase family protein [Solirubrobacteraceae bacterium]|jgi:pyruvate dehydrogenase E2 component (dihydrolipoamide acetyltransferase)|nr:dihydrolipoamide acetyltransferase family protein [Solirubrobacteraceae bacterium]